MKRDRSAAFTPLQHSSTKTCRHLSKPSATRTLKRPEGRAPVGPRCRAAQTSRWSPRAGNRPPL